MFAEGGEYEQQLVVTGDPASASVALKRNGVTSTPIHSHLQIDR